MLIDERSGGPVTEREPRRREVLEGSTRKIDWREVAGAALVFGVTAIVYLLCRGGW